MSNIPNKEPISILIRKDFLSKLKKAYKHSTAPSMSSYLENLILIGFNEMQGDQDE